MTRFQIVGIFNDKILTAGEFNGDGYFENGHGEQLCAKFPEIKTEEDYRKIVKDMNDQYFEYEEQLVYPVDDIEDLNFHKLKQEHRYYKVWFSDYLYIVNLSDDDKEIIDEHNVHITLKPNGWVTLNFGELYEQDDPDYKIKCRNNCEIDRLSCFKEICENQGWHINVYETDIELNKYTPAGEDFSFTIDANDDLQRQVEEYADDFDVDEHVKMWIGGPGAPSSIRCLLEDAEWIDEDLHDLAKALIK